MYENIYFYAKYFLLYIYITKALFIYHNKIIFQFHLLHQHHDIFSICKVVNHRFNK